MWLQPLRSFFIILPYTFSGTKSLTVLADRLEPQIPMFCDVLFFEICVMDIKKCLPNIQRLELPNLHWIREGETELGFFFPLVHRVTSKWLFTVEIPTWGPIETSTFSHTFHETIANVWRFSCSLKGCRSSVYVEVSRVIRFPRVCLARRCFCRCRKGNVWNSLFLWSLSYVHQQCGEWCPFFISFFYLFVFLCIVYDFPM